MFSIFITLSSLSFVSASLILGLAAPKSTASSPTMKMKIQTTIHPCARTCAKIHNLVGAKQCMACMRNHVQQLTNLRPSSGSPVTWIKETISPKPTTKVKNVCLRCSILKAFDTKTLKLCLNKCNSYLPTVKTAAYFNRNNKLSPISTESTSDHGTSDPGFKKFKLQTTPSSPETTKNTNTKSTVKSITKQRKQQQQQQQRQQRNNKINFYINPKAANVLFIFIIASMLSIIILLVIITIFLYKRQKRTSKTFAFRN